MAEPRFPPGTRARRAQLSRLEGPLEHRTLGLKRGFELHQQLDTHKLFCEDPSYVSADPPRATFRWWLRPTQSELGEVDAAALEEARRNLLFAYERPRTRAIRGVLGEIYRVAA